MFSFFRPSQVEDSYDYYIVQFSGPVKASWKNTLTEFGARFYDYIPQYAFIVKLPTANEDAVNNLDFVRYLGDFTADLSLSKGVYDIAPDQLGKQDDLLDLRVVAFPGEELSVMESRIASAGGTVVSSSFSEWDIIFEVRISIKDAGRLKEVTGVKWVETSPEHTAGNNIAVGIMEVRSEQTKTWPVSGTNLLGEGQMIAICDSGIDTGDVASIHEDFSNGQGGSRIVEYNVLSGAATADYSGHGTHVAGIVAGNGMRSGAIPSSSYFPDTCYAGVAPKAEIYFEAAGAADGSSHLPGIPSDLSDLFQPAYNAGARIHTNSWGTSGAGNYNSESLAVDRFMWSNKDFLILFAAGNTGYDKDLDGIVDLYCIDSPATAKNCLSVGASESYRVGSDEGYAASTWGKFRTYADPVCSDLTSDKPYGIASFSSRGPTIDGRYKPEVVAPGTNILSTRSSQQKGNGWGEFNEYYFWEGGTSMATPFTAGTALLMREYLIKEEEMSDPSAALIKTSLIHGAVSLVPGQYGTDESQEVTGAPDNVQGWGRVDFESSINSDNSYETRYYDINDSVPEDSDYSRSFTFEVNNSDKPFKATLGWTDYPGSLLACGGLVNDLDLRVKKPDGTYVYPDNALSASSLTEVCYVKSVSSFYAGDVVGLLVTPPACPGTLESVLLAYSNPRSELSDVSVVVYRYSDGVGEEIFRKNSRISQAVNMHFP